MEKNQTTVPELVESILKEKCSVLKHESLVDTLVQYGDLRICGRIDHVVGCERGSGSVENGAAYKAACDNLLVEAARFNGANVVIITKRDAVMVMGQDVVTLGGYACNYTLRNSTEADRTVN